MLIENYAGTLRRLSNENNITLHIEAYDGAPCDFLEYGGMADQPTGEFWTNKRCLYSDMRGTASAAHIYGKNTVGAEAFTAFPPDRFSTHPGGFKPIGDMAFCEGANQFYVVSYTHQPRPDNLRPGLLFYQWGSHYERTQPWWEKTLPWHRYLTRCQFMLKQGNPVADIAYLEPENSPQKFTDHPRDGYLWDHINFHALDKATVDKQGRVVLPSGMTYKVLVLPNTGAMSLPLADCLLRLANAGATILGGKPPSKVPGLANAAAEERILAQKVAALWGNKKVSVGKPPQQVLLEKGVKPDFSSGEKLSFIHRKIVGGADIYFVANTENKRVATRATFRANAKGTPELWNPQNGKRIAAPLWAANKDGTTTLLLALAPTESVFVVFPENNDSRADHAAHFSIERDGVPIFSGGETAPLLGGAPVPQFSEMEFCYFADSDDPLQSVRFRPPGKYVLRAGGKVVEKTVPQNNTFPLAGDWTLTFPGKTPLAIKELVSWTSLPDPENKYFSGTASYAKTFTVPAGFVKQGRRLILNLGAVSEIAEVFINGKKIDTLWMPEKRLDITGNVRPGETARLEIHVTNLLQNRLIGDQFFPEAGVERQKNGVLKSWPEWYKNGKPIPGKRTTFASWDLYKKTDPLLTSGLLGPVVLETL
jgi:hypothetical protein